MKLVLYTKIFIVEIYYWRIGDLGLLQHANNTTVDKFYGVIAYVAPEIFSKKSCSKKSDIYSLGIIMWEVTTGCRPFANVANARANNTNLAKVELLFMIENSPRTIILTNIQSIH
ncbi:8564_t:CDS:2 [Funneliformis geosporum]|uniref:8564_t:CDS:1 n=1 Tax=Funneliformis geosporum TaxID=1117311 RepID=A0A9W4WWC5_9GLOM|nr:8564_t:CDS:2 [Funneliformis geosporum]